MGERWEPIETAPTKTPVWVWLEAWHMQCVAWLEGDQWWAPVLREGRVAIPAPTHWRPLPDPPE